MIIHTNVIFQASKFPRILLCSVSQRMEKHAMPNSILQLSLFSLPTKYSQEFPDEISSQKIEKPNSTLQQMSLFYLQKIFPKHPTLKFSPWFSQLWQKPTGKWCCHEKTSISDVSAPKRSVAPGDLPTSHAWRFYAMDECLIDGVGGLFPEKNKYIYISVYIYTYIDVYLNNINIIMYIYIDTMSNGWFLNPKGLP